MLGKSFTIQLSLEKDPVLLWPVSFISGILGHSQLLVSASCGTLFYLVPSENMCKTQSGKGKERISNKIIFTSLATSGILRSLNTVSPVAHLQSDAFAYSKC